VRDLKFFDVNVTLGRPAIPKLRTEIDPAVMRADLADVGVSGGLVRHSLSIEWHPTQGNAEISRVLAGVRDFEPVWTLLPHWTGEFPSPDELIAAMARGRVRAATMYPLMHGFPVRPSVTGPLFEALAARRIPLMLPLAQANLATVETIARCHPELPIVVSETSYALVRELYAVFRACPNVYVEISSFMVHRGIEDVVAKFGRDRLLFGTKYPAYNPGCAVAAVMYAKVPDEARAAIAATNAMDLLAKAVLQ
jgi:hypothetical protein